MPHHEMRHAKEHSSKDHKPWTYTEMTDASANLQPAAIITHQEKEVQRHHIGGRQHQQEETERRQIQCTAGHAKYRREYEERNKNLKYQ